MADSQTANYALTKPEVGGSPDTWGNKLNTNFDKIDTQLKKNDASTGTSFRTTFHQDDWVGIYDSQTAGNPIGRIKIANLLGDLGATYVKKAGDTMSGPLSVKPTAENTGTISVRPGNTERTGRIEGTLPNGNRGWYFGHAINRVLLTCENGVTGIDISGSMYASGNISSSGAIIGTVNHIVRGPASNTGNVHLWFRNWDQSVNHGVIYWARSENTLSFSVGGYTARLQASNGQFRVPSDLVAAGIVYAGSGDASLQTNGNVLGTIWANWGHSDAYSAINARIEYRGAVYGQDAKNYAEERSYWRTRDYLMAEGMAVGTAAYRPNGGISGKAGDVRSLNAYGTMPAGSYQAMEPFNNGTTKMWKRVG